MSKVKLEVVKETFSGKVNVNEYFKALMVEKISKEV
jgi:hypothetical protein